MCSFLKQARSAALLAQRKDALGAHTHDSDAGLKAPRTSANSSEPREMSACLLHGLRKHQQLAALGAQQQQPSRRSPGRCWTRPGTRCLTRCSGCSVASGCRKRLTRNAQRASRHEAYLPRRRRGKAWLVVIARSLRTEDATACTPSRWMWINTSTHAGAAWRRVLLAQLGVARACPPGRGRTAHERGSPQLSVRHAIVARVRFASTLEPAARPASHYAGLADSQTETRH